MRQRRYRKFLSRRKKHNSRRGRKTRTRHIMRCARSGYRKRRVPVSRYLDRRIRDNVLSAQKAKHSMTSYRGNIYHRKPLKVGRPRKKKHYNRTRSAFLKAKLKKQRANKKRAKHSALEKKAKRRTRYSDEEVFYSMANASMPKPASEERPTKKHTVRFTTPGNTKTEPQEDPSLDNQSSQQTITPKKRGRHSATPVCKSR